MSANYDVFISYRRTDDHSAGRLSDRLRKEFRTFYDRAMPRGSVFTPETLDALSTAPVVIAVIGGGWMKPETLQRLHSEEDWLRRELEEVFKRQDNVHLIPVLIDDVAMPEKTALPDMLHPLCERQAMRLRVDSWERDVEALVHEIKSSLIQAAKSANSKRKTNPDGSGGIATPGAQPVPPPSGVPWFLTVLLGLVALATGLYAPRALQWARSRTQPGVRTVADLGIRSYHPQMTCELPLEARAGATVTFHYAVLSSARRCKTLFIAALQRGVKLRFLLLHPYAATLQMRVREFKGTYPGYQDEIANSLQVLQEVRHELAGAPGLKIDEVLQVRFYDGLPSVPIFSVHYENNPQDDVLYQGFYLSDENGASALPALELRRGGNGADKALFEPLLSYVEEKWSASKTVSLSVPHSHDDWFKALAKLPVRYRAIEERSNNAPLISSPSLHE